MIKEIGIGLTTIWELIYGLYPVSLVVAGFITFFIAIGYYGNSDDSWKQKLPITLFLILLSILFFSWGLGIIVSEMSQGVPP